MSTQTTVHERIIKTIAEQYGVAIAQVKLDANLTTGLGGDSLDTVETIMALEDEFDINITDEDAEQVETVQQAVDLVEKMAAAS